MLLMPIGYASAKPPPLTAPETKAESEAQKRKQNRIRLLAGTLKRKAVVPSTPEQKRREIAQKLAERAQNREMLACTAAGNPAA